MTKEARRRSTWDKGSASWSGFKAKRFSPAFPALKRPCVFPKRRRSAGKPTDTARKSAGGRGKVFEKESLGRKGRNKGGETHALISPKYDTEFLTEEPEMFNNGCGCGSDIFLILILLCCCGGKNNDCGCGCYDTRKGGGCDCCDLIMLYLLMNCCCGGGKDVCCK